jgi:hypothetical protein
MKCISCNNTKLYKLKTGQLKCSVCKKKFSAKKIQKDVDAIECFTNNLTANQCAKKLGINYVSVKNRYEHIREHVANYLENEYKDKTVLEYDEYIYFEKSKKKIKENIFDAQNFLTFQYEKKIYNLMMPNLHKYKQQLIDDDMQDIYFKEFSKFMMLNKISKTKKRENLITKFWIFFEDSILKYKGVNNKNFLYYLKEIEFKFNYERDEQKKILSLLL